MGERIKKEVHFDFQATTECPICDEEVFVVVHPAFPHETTMEEIAGHMLGVLKEKLESHIGSHYN